LKYHVLFLVGTLLWAAAVPAREEGSTLTRSGDVSAGDSIAPNRANGEVAGCLYVGGGMGYSIEIFSGELDSLDWDSAYNLDLKAGYFFNDFSAFEIVAGYAGPFLHKQEVFGSDYEDMLNVFSLTLNLKVLMPVAENFSLYAVGGAGYGWARVEWDYDNTHDSESGNWLRVGAGMNFYATEHATLELEITYNAGMGDIEDLRYVGLTGNALWIF